MKKPWDEFFREKIKIIFEEKHSIIDIGGGLRIVEKGSSIAYKKNNRLEYKNFWIRDYLKKVDYKILDKTNDYNPDIIGDIHNLPLPDNSVDAIVCIAVLEHVENPFKAMAEIHRVLKKGGYAYIFVPFLYYYHSMKPYYSDYYRFTYDGARHMTRNFSSVEIQNVRGSISTLFHFLPFFSKKTGFFDWVDILLKKDNSRQTSGYNIFCIK